MFVFFGGSWRLHFDFPSNGAPGGGGGAAAAAATIDVPPKRVRLPRAASSVDV